MENSQIRTEETEMKEDMKNIKDQMKDMIPPISTEKNLIKTKNPIENKIMDINPIKEENQILEIKIMV